MRTSHSQSRLAPCGSRSVPNPALANRTLRFLLPPALFLGIVRALAQRERNRIRPYPTKGNLGLKLEEITSGVSLEGVEPSSVVSVVAAIAIPPASLQLVYRRPDGGLWERLLTRSDEPSLREATVARPWSFDLDEENDSA